MSQGRPSKHIFDLEAMEVISVEYKEPKAMEVISVEYKEPKPKRCAAGTFVGIVVKRETDRMKVLFIYESKKPDIAWFQRSAIRADRWIDKTWTTVVTVEEGTLSQREGLLRCLPPEQLKRLINKAGEG